MADAKLAGTRTLRDVYNKLLKHLRNERYMLSALAVEADSPVTAASKTEVYGDFILKFDLNDAPGDQAVTLTLTERGYQRRSSYIELSIEIDRDGKADWHARHKIEDYACEELLVMRGDFVPGKLNGKNAQNLLFAITALVTKKR